MNSEERVIKTLKRERVDRVPTFEWLIDKKVIEAISPGSTYEEFVYEMDLDAIVVDLDYETEKVGPDMYRDEWGIIKKDAGEAHTIPVSGPIESSKDLKNYCPPDPHRKQRYKTLERMLKKHRGKKAVILHLNDVFSIPSRLMKYEDFLLSIAENPELVKALVELSVEINLKMAGEAAKRGVKIVFTGDDFAYNDGPLMSPAAFENIFYPYFCRIIRGFKDLGLLVIKHTDGNIMPLIDMIIDSGIDCLDPIDPLGGMNLKYIKEKYGDKVALKGNIDCANTLAGNDITKTVEETKKCLREGAPGGGFILSSSNSIHSGVNPDSYLAMLNTLKDYGKYPLQW